MTEWAGSKKAREYYSDLLIALADLIEQSGLPLHHDTDKSRSAYAAIRYIYPVRAIDDKADGRMAQRALGMAQRTLERHAPKQVYAIVVEAMLYLYTYALSSDFEDRRKAAVEGMRYAFDNLQGIIKMCSETRGLHKLDATHWQHRCKTLSDSIDKVAEMS